jgi:alpha-tubulin suppressor-like RCC1 family protein
MRIVGQSRKEKGTEKMRSATKNRTTMSKVLALGFLVAALLATLLSSAPAGADVVPAGNARAWGDNYFGQLGNGNTGTDSDVPVAVRNLLNVRNMDGGYEFTLATTG